MYFISPVVDGACIIKPGSSERIQPVNCLLTGRQQQELMVSITSFPPCTGCSIGMAVERDVNVVPKRGALLSVTKIFQ